MSEEFTNAWDFPNTREGYISWLESNMHLIAEGEETPEKVKARELRNYDSLHFKVLSMALGVLPDDVE
jgi:hypothetical protein